MPGLSFELQQELKRSSEDKKKKNRRPILSWQDFMQGLNLENQGPIREEDLKAAASYLHEMGEIIYFGKNVVVTDPGWFCEKIVGQLLLPKEMLEGKDPVQVGTDGSVSISDFTSSFPRELAQGVRTDDVISMLEQLGLCYTKDHQEIIVPALIQEDNISSTGWDKFGSHGVMGRCLATNDEGKTDIPMTLFRWLQVHLAKDFAGRQDSDYRAGRSFSSFKVQKLMVLIQFDENVSDSTDDRIDILVKSMGQEDPSLDQTKRICEIMQKVENLCVLCCPGVTYDVMVIQPWSATEKTPKMTERNLMSLKDIKDRLRLGETHSSWQLNRNPIELKTFLSDSELEKVLEREALDYDGSRRAVVAMGLLTEESLQILEGLEEENSSKAEGLDVKGASIENQNNGGGDITNRELLHQMRQEHHVTRQTVHEEGHCTRQYVKKWNQVLLEIRHKHNAMVRHVQGQQAFSIEETGRSVPRFMFLSRKQGKPNLWISLKEAFKKSFELHLLCESHYDDGFLHEVDDQEGIQLTKSKEWLLKVSPWLRRSLRVAIMVGKAVGNIYVPGVFNFIPDFDFLKNDGERLSKAVDSASTMLLEEDEGDNQFQDDLGNYGTAAAPIDLNERMIAEGVVKDLKIQEGEANFAEKMRLRKVLLNPTVEPHGGSSAYAPSSVAWICESCFKSYGPGRGPSISETSLLFRRVWRNTQLGVPMLVKGVTTTDQHQLV